MPDPSQASAPPARVLGPIDATCIVVGAIIGVGIFFNPSGVARLTGDADLALLAWAVAGGIALCGALTFAALGSRYHSNGAQYEVLRDAYGTFPAFLFVFCNATAIQAGAVAVIAVICARNLGVAAGTGIPEGVPLLALAAALILGLVGANIVGVRWGSRIQNLTVYAKLVTLLVVTALAFVAAPSTPEPPPETGNGARRALGPFGAILAALVPCLFAYGGWQHSLWISGEVKEPRRNLPRAIVGGVVLVVIVYLLANWAYLRLLGVRGVAESGALAADAVAVVWPEVGRRVVAAAVAVSAFGVLNAQLLSGPRLVYGMARDGRFFGVFGRLSPRFGTPVGAIVLIGVMALVLMVAPGRGVVDVLTAGTVFIDAVFFVLTGAALFVLRGREAKGPAAPARRGETGRLRDEETKEAFRAVGYPVVPALFVVGELGVLVGACLGPGGWVIALAGVGWIVGTAIIYLAFFRR